MYKIFKKGESMKKVALLVIIMMLVSIGSVYCQDSSIGGKSVSSKAGIKTTVIEDATSINLLTGTGYIHSIYGSLQAGDELKIWDCTDATNITVFSAHINAASDGQLGYYPTEPIPLSTGLYLDVTIASSTTSSFVLQWE